MRLITALLFLLIITGQAHAQFRQQQLSPVQEKILRAMQSDIRTDAEKNRDRNRNPLATLDFFGLKEDMKVIELVPGGGWYTKILAPVLRDKGELYITQPRYYGNRMDGVLKLAGMDKVKTFAWNDDPDAGGFSSPGDWKIKNADMVLTFRNYHNFSEEARMKINRESYEALKPGGVYAIIDHTRRHMEPDYRENGRRADPVLVIKEVQNAGFVLVDYSDIHYKPDDELRFEVGRTSVRGNSDRFTLLFRKPD